MNESPWKKLAGQVIFGNADFISDIQSRRCEEKEIGEIPHAQKFAEKPSLKNIFPPENPQNKTLRNEKITIAHIPYEYTLKAIAEHLKIHYTTVSKRVKK
ncbi:hypothetical protein JWG39_12020 [Desulforhopalus vacuolatus]|uniref:hypothetical protein n=1 Tax=Desulforhopalus vacuolatus TaxID=40414 RepID=UPI0019634FC4|nr:hypothetical protein [Desulforhopalus vacuolatus]MBM9520542.1 hypothetical protein [Desulforhopalus vacuolatus]